MAGHMPAIFAYGTSCRHTSGSATRMLSYLLFVSPYPGLGTRSTTCVAGLLRAVSTGVNRPLPAFRPIVIVLDPPLDFAMFGPRLLSLRQRFSTASAVG
jgi:hypothetical protein